ncbi:IclR family transcriptional regulator C-terminal domain-containing protein [Nocardioides sp. GY 10127]|uniref:IclR family transcriptional regulator domain-containing protein n=1 Tax=Nocardioides sp. GY 10127 TaxID=2569762 RepID=UPI0010A75FD9|nr:IclR family transcriptional regulator C-terminal domain-containing protein [Nocardioides sp. GY 10127]TIC80058.1 winged helix-turn-helix transcriptional regulator [Nocardioides sp. GY 10127]
MAERGTGPDFIESLARGLDVIRAFDAQHAELTMSELAELTGLARPTVRRILLTLEELGYVRSGRGGFSLTARVLELGLAHVSSSGLWDVARPHMERLVSRTGESSSAAQLEGSDIVYVARVAVPKIIALRVDIGTRFPAASTSLGKVLMSRLEPAEVERVLAHPSRSGVVARHVPSLPALLEELAAVRERGWCLTDEQLAAGVRSVAAPLHAADGSVLAAMNVTVHAAETSVEVLLEEHLPRLLEATAAIDADLSLLGRVPMAGPR